MKLLPNELRSVWRRAGRRRAGSARDGAGRVATAQAAAGRFGSGRALLYALARNALRKSARQPLPHRSEVLDFSWATLLNAECVALDNRRARTERYRALQDKRGKLPGAAVLLRLRTTATEFEHWMYIDSVEGPVSAWAARTMYRVPWLF